MLRRRQVFPCEIVRDDLGLLADDALGAPIAPFGKQPAEFVDDVVGVEPDAHGVVADVAAREDALGPARQIVLFERFPELDAELRFRGQLSECDALAFASGSEDRTEGFLLESHVFSEAKTLPTKSLQKWSVFDGTLSEIALSEHAKLQYAQRRERGGAMGLCPSSTSRRP